MTTVALHHILLKSPLLADDILNELALGADFADLAEEYSACPSAQQHGFAGYHHLDQLPTAIVKALANWDGERPYTDAVKTHLGLHILKPVSQLDRTLLTDDLADDVIDSSAGVTDGHADEAANEVDTAAIQTS